jgi:hypothetical protein
MFACQGLSLVGSVPWLLTSVVSKCEDRRVSCLYDGCKDSVAQVSEVKGPSCCIACPRIGAPDLIGWLRWVYQQDLQQLKAEVSSQWEV